jgi:putative sugar O-methyltransferase
VINQVKSVGFYTHDLFRRIMNRFNRVLYNLSPISNDPVKSDSEVSFYSDTVDAINSDPKRFRKFRRIYNYREILEHMSYKQGLVYLKRISAEYPSFDLKTFFPHPNDSIGSPRIFKYSDFQCSPTTIRYLSVALDIKSTFPEDDIKNIVEIGAGYGGQSSILQDFLRIEKYVIYDLPNVQDLIANFLDPLGKMGYVEFKKIEPGSETIFDFALSNYAFSELPKMIQEIYLKTVLSKSKSGYMIMNSGLTDYTGRSEGKLSLADIRKHLPNSVIVKENPLTSKDNYILMWGNKLNLINHVVINV